jgi:hypothetical protein
VRGWERADEIILLAGQEIAVGVMAWRVVMVDCVMCGGWWLVVRMRRQVQRK